MTKGDHRMRLALALDEMRRAMRDIDVALTEDRYLTTGEAVDLISSAVAARVSTSREADAADMWTDVRSILEESVTREVQVRTIIDGRV